MTIAEDGNSLLKVLIANPYVLRCFLRPSLTEDPSLCQRTGKRLNGFVCHPDGYGGS